MEGREREGTDSMHLYQLNSKRAARLVRKPEQPKHLGSGEGTSELVGNWNGERSAPSCSAKGTKNKCQNRGIHTIVSQMRSECKGTKPRTESRCAVREVADTSAN